ncbi:MAG TPA: MATE family efflux transporter [Bacillota bacterium]|jgi:putative MATE family efflux protein|nr:MATE family efflux transporter [Bacillota bacterium]
MNSFSKQRKIIFSLALPIIIQNIVAHVQILFDRAFLGNLDVRYLTVVGNVMVPFEALLFFYFAAANGITILVAQNIGAKKFKRAQQLSESSYFYFTLISTGLFLFWIVGAKAVFSLLGVTGVILKEATVFTQILSVSLIFAGIDISSASILQGIGQTKPIMVFGIARSILNIVLDWLLIFGHMGLPAMGMEGAALATAIANVLGSIGLFMTAILSKKLPYRISIKGILSPKWRHCNHMLKLGLPSGLESLLYYTGLLVLTRLMNRIDDMAVGIFSLINGIQIIGVLIYLGFARASMTVVGQYWGEKNYREAKRSALYCLRLSYYITLTCSVIFLTFPHFLIGIFTTDTQVIDRAVPLLRFIAIFINFDVMNIMMGHAIRATGDTKWMLYTQIVGTLYVIALSSVMIINLNLGLWGMYIVMLSDEIIRAGVNFLRFVKGGNPFRRKMWVENAA